MAGAVHGLASGFAAASFLLVLLTLCVPLRLPGKPGWSEAVLVLTGTLATLVSQTRRLPLQNVMLAAGIIGLMGGAIHAVGAATAIPFGPFSYTDSAGPRVFGTLAWPIPFVWIIVILNSRDVARLILRPWRKLRSYGFWLIGITVALTVLFDLAFEPFAASVKHYWLWHPTRLPLTWFGAPVTNFLGWLVTALLTLAFATPALIDKRQQRSAKRPADYHPLVVWLLAVALLGVGAATHQLWPAVIYCITAGLAVSIFAIRGARW
jgi:putative membrane protein